MLRRVGYTLEAYIRYKTLHNIVVSWQCRLNTITFWWNTNSDSFFLFYKTVWRSLQCGLVRLASISQNFPWVPRRGCVSVVYPYNEESVAHGRAECGVTGCCGERWILTHTAYHGDIRTRQRDVSGDIWSSLVPNLPPPSIYVRNDLFFKKVCSISCNLLSQFVCKKINFSSCYS